MQVHAFVDQVVIAGDQAIQNNRTVRIGSFRRGLIIVAANEIRRTRRPREPIRRIKVSKIGKHSIIRIARVVANQEFDHRTVLIGTTPGDIHSTDFRRGSHKVAVMEMMIVKLLMRREGLFHSKQSVPFIVVDEVLQDIKVAVRFRGKPIS